MANGANKSSSASGGRVVRTRFAPSPSGHLHVGGARTALFCWAYARSRGGKFMLRIEDTDQKRSSDAASLAFLEDLKWLGIEWDEGPEYEGYGGGELGPYFQSERLGIYNRYADQLIADGKGYRAFETPDELQAARDQARREKRNYRYDRAALKLSDAQVKQYLAEGRPHVVRFKVPEQWNGGDSVIVHDEVRGDVAVALAELDDFVLRKADGYPTYHFAVVVDDELMGVTHVIRAQEHLSNTPRHVLLQDALGWGGRRPVYAHISLITNPDGSKMSKRDKDKALRAAVRARKLSAPPVDASGALVVSGGRWDWWLAEKDRQLDLPEAEKLAEALAVELPEIEVDEFARQGYLPGALLNYLALLGWSPGGDIEQFDRTFLVEKFSLDRVITAPAKFDRQKLLAFNHDAIQRMDAKWFADLLLRHAQRRASIDDYGRHSPEHQAFLIKLASPMSDDPTNDVPSPEFEVFASANQSRAKTLEDPFRSCRFLVLADDAILLETSKTVRDALENGEPNGYAHLEALLARLRDLPQWSVKDLEATVKHYADASAGGKLGNVAQPLRIAVTGGTISPAIFDTLAMLGRESTLNRIERCLAKRPVISKA